MCTHRRNALIRVGEEKELKSTKQRRKVSLGMGHKPLQHVRGEYSYRQFSR